MAWFSPFPPVRTGISGRSAELVALLRARGFTIDPYPEQAAHDFPWRHQRAPYDLVVYQFGNSSHHDYEWPYALRYPGLVVLHDTRLHHARAALLLRERRAEDYRAEFAWNHPDVGLDAAELAVAGFDSRLYYEWPMVASLIATARLTAVHGEGARGELVASLSMPNSATPKSQSTPKAQFPKLPKLPQLPKLPKLPSAELPSRIVAIRLGEGETLTPEREAEARARVRGRYGIAPDAVVFGVFGGLTPEKRVPQILAAFRATLPYARSARLLLAGARASHYDVAADIASNDVADRVTMTGYLDSDADVTDHLAACDVSLNLRWPTARETSGPWLRALAAGRATVVTELVHHTDVPSLDPRSWAIREARGARGEARSTGHGERDRRNPGGRTGLNSTSDEMTPAVSNTDDRSGAAGRTSHLAPRTSAAVCIGIDILDEDHSLRLAMRRVATDPALRAELGAAGREWWTRRHTPALMADDYARVIEAAMNRSPSDADLPAHLRGDGRQRARALLAPFGLDVPF